MNERKIESIVEWYLEDNTFEEFLEEFDLTPHEAAIALFKAGLLDEYILESFERI